MGQKAIVGLSVETWEDVEVSQKTGCKLHRCQSGFFYANQNRYKKRLGFKTALAKIKAFSRHPLVAIGGINESKCP